jgi:hypothetical protein
MRISSDLNLKFDVALGGTPAFGSLSAPNGAAPELLVSGRTSILPTPRLLPILEWDESGFSFSGRDGQDLASALSILGKCPGSRGEDKVGLAEE